MSITDFLFNVLGMPQGYNIMPVVYIIASVLLLILLDGLLTFIISGITSLTTRGFK